MISFDIIVIGAGPGGYVAAIRAAQLGMKVAIVEKEGALGGTCLRVGCIPSKALLESSELYHTTTHQLADHGIRAKDVSIDVETMMARKVKIVTELTDGIGLLMKKNKVSVYRGTGRLEGDGVVEVEGLEGPTQLRAPSIVLATGSTSTALPNLPFDGSRIVSSTEALAFERPPEHLVVVGAGAVGLELGSVWLRLGSRVTVVELLPRIVPFADRTMVQILQRSLKQQGMDIRLQTKITDAEVAQSAVTVTLEDRKGKAERLTCDRVLVAVGRRAYTEGLGLERVGLKTDDGGRIAVVGSFKTSVPGLFAIGDLIAGPMLAHKAEEEGIAVAELIGGHEGHVNYDAIPSVVYTSPELAHVGVTEDQAKDSGVPYRSGKFFFKANGRAKSLSQVDGLVKILAHAETDRLLGVHIVGPRASDLIAEAVLAFEFHASAEDLARTIHAHPTLSEVVKEAALAVDKRALHG